MTAVTAEAAVVGAGTELDAAPALRARITRLTAEGCRVIILDLGATARIDWSGAGVLAGAHRRLRGGGGTLAVAAASGRVLRTLRACGLDRILHFCPAVEDAATAGAKDGYR